MTEPLQASSLAETLDETITNQLITVKMADKRDQLTTILKTGNQATIAFATSLLEGAGIKFFIKNEGLQNLFGAGQIGTSYNPIVGVPEIQVFQGDVDKANELLIDIEKGNMSEVDNSFDSSEEYYEKDIVSEDSTKKYSNMLKGILIGLVIAGIAFFFYERHQNNISGDFQYDMNKDSKTDVIHTYENGEITKVVADRNHDGRMDEWHFYKNDMVASGKSDDNFDGDIDTW
jgi:hypothetical protein